MIQHNPARLNQVPQVLDLSSVLRFKSFVNLMEAMIIFLFNTAERTNDES